MNTQPRILAQEVSYTYEEAETPALQKVSAAIAPGEFVAVLGHNGSGKSTFAKLLNALYIPTEGRLLVCGLDTREEDKVWDVRQHAGMIFQNPDNQLVATVVREDVAFGLENLGVPTDEMVRRIDAALEAVHMTEFAASAPFRWPEATGGHCRGAGHGAGDPGCRRGHGHAGPLWPAGCAGNRPPPEQGKGHYGGVDYPLYGRGYLCRPGVCNG